MEQLALWQLGRIQWGWLGFAGVYCASPKLGYRKPRMPKEPEDEIRTLAESRKAAIHLGTEFVNAAGGGIAEMLFDVAVAALLGVQVP